MAVIMAVVCVRIVRMAVLQGFMAMGMRMGHRLGWFTGRVVLMVLVV